LEQQAPTRTLKYPEGEILGGRTDGARWMRVHSGVGNDGFGMIKLVMVSMFSTTSWNYLECDIDIIRTIQLSSIKTINGVTAKCSQCALIVCLWSAQVALAWFVDRHAVRRQDNQTQQSRGQSLSSPRILAIAAV
jgi:hypothetical protein